MEETIIFADGIIITAIIVFVLLIVLIVVLIICRRTRKCPCYGSDQSRLNSQNTGHASGTYNRDNMGFDENAVPPYFELDVRKLRTYDSIMRNNNTLPPEYFTTPDEPQPSTAHQDHAISTSPTLSAIIINDDPSNNLSNQDATNDNTINQIDNNGEHASSLGSSANPIGISNPTFESDRSADTT